ncbi:CcoQ/FixQ family Cbb3-type cytochrome c oxidase assembly chaperone [Brumimicrobium glaciale]|uniref:CcoQ/FixQ family Cbb3-type cytochrome c oxidase assembly chaperone n=1 Tax=Brumimicrobium glaciale TaxID=200475 RepID=A0A4Q4KG06_9FLAO|nr:CcoQ/FixQ family Cbb3-type cytochrome c oxidase assembly chaperone [Brumimicrobium glaciale]RYM32051.1 CcoQ/FixQ family Cbb3-type cytochrome c oxidase assembly chaperone [Brumimicrobium glaciale]
MLRYIKHNMSEIVGIEIFPIISLLIFTIFFAGVLWRMYKMTKTETDIYGQIPLLEDDEVIDTNDTKD